MPVRVIDLALLPDPVSSALRRVCLVTQEATALVIDARQVTSITTPTLGVLVRLRRRQEARGGSVVVVAGEAVWAALRRTGLRYSLPCVVSPDQALQVIRDASETPLVRQVQAGSTRSR